MSEKARGEGREGGGAYFWPALAVKPPTTRPCGGGVLFPPKGSGTWLERGILRIYTRFGR